MNNDIHNECCKGCKYGHKGPCEAHTSCAMYDEEYAEIEADWKLKATLMTETDNENV